MFYALGLFALFFICLLIIFFLYCLLYMESLAIVGIVSLLGYSFAEKEGIRDVSITDPTRSITRMPDEERPVSTNIYNSNMYQEAEDKTLNLAINNYKKAEEPSLTGVLPPIYNSYSAIGNDSVLKNPLVDGSVKTLSDINTTNRYKDVTNVTNNEPSVTARPMFKPLLNLDTEASVDFSNFGQGVPYNQNISLLTGQPIEREHANQVPWFGSNVKQNVESFTNTARLDHFTGNTSTFMHKNEQGPLFDSYQQDIYGTPQVTTAIEMDRFIPSVYRQNEKPFESEKVNAPISGTIDNPVTAAASNFRTVDQLRTANKPQVSYAGRTVAGKFGNVRGVHGNVAKNKVDTHFELGQDRLFTSTGAFVAKQAPQDYSQMQPTSRQSQNLEYYGTLVSKDKKQEPRYTLDNSDEFSVLAQENRRQQLDSDTQRNVSRTTANNGDYGKESYNLPELERDSTSAFHTLNINKSDKGHKLPVQDDIKHTTKQTTLYVDNSGNINSRIKKSDTSGLIGVNFKTTNKETTIHNKYKGQPNKKDQMGYNIANYNAKTTHKETVSQNNYNGHAADTNKNSMVYSTYFNPEKVRNPAMAVNYQGHAGFEVGQSESRSRFDNAEVNENSTVLVSNQRPSGPQNYNIAGGVGVVGDAYVKPNKLLSEEVTSNPNITNISNVIPSKSKIGLNESEISRNVYGEVENNRETLDFASLVNSQLQSNPFYNLKRT
jgi:hypothetical protein